VSCQFHVPAALSQVPIDKEARLAPQRVWMFQRKEIPFVCWESNLGSSIQKPSHYANCTVAVPISFDGQKFSCIFLLSLPIWVFDKILHVWYGNFRMIKVHLYYPGKECFTCLDWPCSWFTVIGKTKVRDISYSCQLFPCQIATYPLFVSPWRFFQSSRGKN
jgi:hypothetical protein